ncbi:hypothetical protein PV343_07230 [Streptomyces sp. WI03-4A]|nr:PQQ-binding-like beta-propeller repeat protein [Streptomyces sp. WI03-4A]MDX2592052.1 hypothetical protein [Streptomyces sp. WI03-4A]
MADGTGQVKTYASPHTAPVVADGTVYVGRDRGLIAVDAVSGEQR